ncbi:MAG: four helix bundle protein [Paludibacter sp.]
MKTKSFEELLAWQKAHAFVLKIYKITKNFPKEELFGLTSQLKRAAISIPANIAEGYKKNGVKDKIRFFNIAQGSLEECRYFLILARDIEFISLTEFEDLKDSLNSASYMINAYQNTIRENLNNDKKI